MSRRYAVAFTAAIGGFMATFELTVVNVALVALAADLGADLSTIQRLVTASFLAVRGADAGRSPEPLAGA